VFDGFDAPKEFGYLGSIHKALLRRNVAALHVDHPGVGAALRKLGMPAIKDMERPATASLEWLLRRGDIDPKRIGIIAPSLGGYYAARAAAFEPRLACCVAWGARFDNDGSHGRILRNPNAARSLSDWVDHAMWYYGTNTVEETATAIAAMNLDGGVMERIRCPLLVAHGAHDRQVPIEQAHTMVDRAVNAPRRDLKLFYPDEGGVEHCGVDNMTVQTDFMADWIAEILGGRLGP
jgi:dienelactone hydrolase